MDSLEGRVAVITGGASGIGLAMATLFASEGAKVALADVDGEALDVVTARLAAQGADVIAVPTDVADATAVEALAERVLERFGTVNVICNNAGTVVMGPTWDVPLTDWRRIVGVNFWGVVHGIHAFVPRMLATGEPGYVVNTASMAGVTSLPGLAPYVATKHAVVSLSEVLHHDLRAAGSEIGVSVVCPGLVATHLGQTDKLSPVDASGPGVLSAQAVAETVRSAMAERRFYVFTHPGSTRGVEARARGIVEGRAPSLMPLPDR